jgi:hypothetical protein
MVFDISRGHCHPYENDIFLHTHPLKLELTCIFWGAGRKTNILVCASFMLIVSSTHRQIPTDKREIALPFFICHAHKYPLTIGSLVCLRY